MSRRRSSISVPIMLAVLGVGLSIALLVAWSVILADSEALAHFGTWLLVLGIISFAVIMSVLVMFAVYLVGQIREVTRQTRFIDSVTHELKSPLASLKLCLQTLGREGLTDDQRGQLGQMMHSDVDRLSTFIDDILTASRLTTVLPSSRSEAHALSEVGLAELVDRVCEPIQRRYGLPPDAVVNAVPEELEIVTDDVALATVLTNLVDNAVKYSLAAEGGSPETIDVRVEATLDERVLRIEVRDQGVGIPAGQLKKVFERFYRVETEAVRSRRGVGLGLYVASQLVRSIGGRLTAHSEGPGRGTTMRVQLSRKGLKKRRRRLEGDAR